MFVSRATAAKKLIVNKLNLTSKCKGDLKNLNRKSGLKNLLTIITSMPLITPLDFEEEIRKFSEQSPKLPPINKPNCFGKVCANDGNFYESLKLPEISTAVRLSRRKIRKKAAKKAEKSSSEVPIVKKRRVPPIRRMPGETTVSFSVVSSASGSRNIVIQRQLSPGSVDRQETDC